MVMMMMMPLGVWSVVATVMFMQVISAVVLGILLLTSVSSKYKNLPPGPQGLPVVGSLHLLGKSPHLSFTELAETYGPLMSVWLGPRLAVVATSPEATEEILKMQGSNFTNQIATSFGDVILPGGTIVASSSYPWELFFGLGQFV